MAERFDDLAARVDVLAGLIDDTARRLNDTDRHVLNIEDSVTRMGEQIADLQDVVGRLDRADHAAWSDPLGHTPLHDMLTTDLGPPQDLVIGAYKPEPRRDAQSAAFRDSTEADWTSDDDIAAMRDQST